MSANPNPVSLGITEYDLYLFGKGEHHRIYEKLGARLSRGRSSVGASFAVWAPNARRISVVGDFNEWDERRHPMRNRGDSGVWETFIPGLEKGGLYKYKIVTSTNNVVLKADPYAFFSEKRPKTASIIWDIDSYTWSDEEWVRKRDTKNPLAEPIAVYEVHCGSWRRVAEEGNRFLTYQELAHVLVPYVKDMGFTHIELLPIMAHPYDASWGYQVSGYYSVTARYGTPDEFMYFVDFCHQNGIGVILDWVPAHFPRDEHALARFDGTCLYEHYDPKQGEQKDWGTLVFNYGRREVFNFLLANALFWLEKYHIDGLRVDAVASMLYLDYSRGGGEWVPNKYGGRENLEAIEFLKRLNYLAYQYFPGILMIAEESTAWPGVTRPTDLGGLGFGLKWNMGWMNDTLSYMSKDSIHKKFHQGKLTFGLLYAFQENFMLPLSHDEVVHGKRSLLDRMPGDVWQKFANLRLLLAYMYGYPGKKLLFMGSEIGQWNEWDFQRGLDWYLLDEDLHRRLQRFVKDLNTLYCQEHCLNQIDFRYSGFEWIDFHDADSSIITFLRKTQHPGDIVILACNFTPIVREDYRVGVPFAGLYRELLNTDSECYGGSNTGNLGGVHTESFPWNDRPYSLNMTLPPLGAVILKPEQVH